MQDISEINPSQSNLDSSVELHKLLQFPKKASSEWQTHSSKLVALLHNKTLLAETDEHVYIYSLASCKWAQNAGVLEAKKKNLQAIRFRTSCPPSLKGLDEPQLINAALELFMSLKGAWCRDYITNEIIQRYVDKKGVGLLFKWAEKNALSTSDFFKITLSGCLTSDIEEARILALIKESGAKLKFSNDLSNEAVSKEVLEIVNFLKDLKKEIKAKKALSSIDSLMKIVIEKARNSHPTVVLHGYFLLSLTIFDEIAENKKVAQNFITEQIFSILKVAEDLCSFGGEDGVTYFRKLHPTLKKINSNFEKYLEDSSKSNPNLLKLREEHINNSVDRDSIEDSGISIYARLLTAWNDFYVSQAESSNLSLINSDLLAAAKLNGIEFLGVAGDNVSFDPIMHKLSGSEQTASATISIVRPAIIFRRTNGTYRIILPAIVNPI